MNQTEAERAENVPSGEEKLPPATADLQGFSPSHYRHGASSTFCALHSKFRIPLMLSFFSCAAQLGTLPRLLPWDLCPWWANWWSDRARHFLCYRTRIVEVLELWAETEELNLSWPEEPRLVPMSLSCLPFGQSCPPSRSLGRMSNTPNCKWKRDAGTDLENCSLKTILLIFAEKSKTKCSIFNKWLV